MRQAAMKCVHGLVRRSGSHTGQVEALEVYPSKKPNAPIFVFIHGGAWRTGEAKNYRFPAELFVDAGVNYIALDFISVDAANGDIGIMADQVCRTIAWTFKNAASFQGDPNRLYIGGILPAVICAGSRS